MIYSCVSIKLVYVEISYWHLWIL